MRIVSLFDYTGIWSKPYRQAGYIIEQVDIQLGYDVYESHLETFTDVQGILAAPPCTDFASSGARWFAEKDKDGRTQKSIGLVLRVLELVHILNPEWWVIENPVGRINSLIPELGKARFVFDPCDYGMPFTKRTQLWGEFTVPEKGTIVKPEGYRPGQPNAWFSKVGGKSLTTKNYRSATIPQFAQAFFEANP